MKTSELTGPALDWAVAKCEGFAAEYEADIGDFWIERTNHKYPWLAPFGYLKDALHFSTDWAQGGPIIERERITIQFDGDGINADLTTPEGKFYQGFGEDSPLIAAMRCFVSSKLGDEVEIPQELTQ